MKNETDLVFMKLMGSKLHFESTSFGKFFNMALIYDDELSETFIKDFNIKYLYKYKK